MAARQRTSGFTLIEMAITMVILVILLSLAAPSFQEFIANQRSQGAAGDLLASLMYARSEAIKRGGVIDLEPVSGGTNWSSGWAVKNGTDELRKQGALASSIEATGPDGAISFGANGRLTSTNAAEFRFGIEVSSEAPRHMRCIVLDPGGRPATYVDKNGDGNCTNG